MKNAYTTTTSASTPVRRSLFQQLFAVTCKTSSRSSISSTSSDDESSIAPPPPYTSTPILEVQLDFSSSTSTYSPSLTFAEKEVHIIGAIEEDLVMEDIKVESKEEKKLRRKREKLIEQDRRIDEGLKSLGL